MKGFWNQNKLRNRNKINNRGSSLVIVIIAFGFIGILASILLYMSMLNYQMKKNNLAAKDNFYGAETVIDEIRVGMVGDMSNALQHAYQEVLIHFDDTTVEGKESKLRYEFFTGIETAFAADGDVTTYDLCKLYDYLEKTEAVFDGGSFAYGAVLESEYNGVPYQIMKNEAGDYVDEDNQLVVGAKGKLERRENAIIFRGLKVTYTDPKGYVSIIETDLCINMPQMEFVKSVVLPPLNDYALVAQENIAVIPVQDGDLTLPSNNRIGGSFYAKRLLVGNNWKEEDAERQAPLVELTLQESVGAENENKRMVLAEDIYMNAGTKLSTDSYGELWADTIVMNGAHQIAAQTPSRVELNGNDVYLANDVLLQGNKNYFKVGSTTSDGKYIGKFMAFGHKEEAEKSSSIVINGTESELHFEELTYMTIAGNTYIGLQDVTDGLTQEDEVANAVTLQDIPMGQSIAVKSDQIAYLIPADCLAINAKTGEQVKTDVTNPMTVETRKNILQQEYVLEVCDSIPCDALGGKTLADYGLKTSGVNPDFQKYFKRVSSDITLVYYYVLFDSADEESMRQANAYFQDYYKVHKDTLDAYHTFYTDSVQLRESSTGYYTLHLAGNVVQQDTAGATAFQSATAAYDDNNVNYKQQLLTCESKYISLTKKLLDVSDLLTAAELADSANVYLNLVNEAKITSFVTQAQAQGEYGINENGSNVYYFGDLNGKAAVIDGDYTYTGSGESNFNGLILATGDVTVSKDFQGTILAGGSITIDRNVSVEPNEDAVINAMKSYQQIGEVKYHVTDFLYGGEGYLSNQDKGYLKNDVNLGELITYENWQKK